MHTKHLIDAIVQQTTVLIAQLATSTGIRAPLAHLADQVFLELSQEIEQQGVSRNVVADMFGLALRSYQKKVNRLRASAGQTERTLWQSVLEYVQEQESATRNQVLTAFADNDERHVIAVLGDLVAGGLLYATGRGQHAAYRSTPADDQNALVAEQELDLLTHLVWLEVAQRPSTLVQLQQRFDVHADQLEGALARLQADGRLFGQDEAGEMRYHTQRVLIEAGCEAGWETAVFDHYRAVCNALVSKLRSGGAGAPEAHLIGGTTLRFEVHPKHPHAEEAKALLESFRGQAFALWERVAAYNEKHPVAEQDRTQVVFYFGQNIIDPKSEEEAGHETNP